MIPAIGKALGPSFEPSFLRMLPSLMGYTLDDHDIVDHIFMAGCFCECYRKVPSLIPITLHIIFPVLLRFANVGDDELARNTAYCIGSIVEFSEPTLLTNSLE